MRRAKRATRHKFNPEDKVQIRLESLRDSKQVTELPRGKNTRQARRGPRDSNPRLPIVKHILSRALASESRAGARLAPDASWTPSRR
jgi:hypothetical protein